MCIREADAKSMHQSLPLQKFPHHVFHIAVLPIHGIVQLLHFLIGNFSGQRSKRLSHLRMLP